MEKIKKKKLNEKEKKELKRKLLKSGKIVLDVLMYGFALVMALALALSSCNTRKVSAYFHGDNIYTSLNNVSVDIGSNNTTGLYYYYDYNSRITFPQVTDLIGAGLYTTSNYAISLTFSPSITIDGETYSTLQFANEYLDREAYLSISSDADYPMVKWNTNSPSTPPTFLRVDLLTSLFNGSRTVTLSSSGTTDTRALNFYRFLAYYFGEYGYNRIQYVMPIDFKQYYGSFVYTDDSEPTLEDGYFFKNSYFDTLFDYSVSHFRVSDIKLTMARGAFRCNGVYYTGIEFTFSTVYGWWSDVAPLLYWLPGSTSISDGISSNNEFYKGYYYLSSIAYTRSSDGISTTVWNAGLLTTKNDIAGYNFERGGWVGDTYSSTSPYRNLYIFRLYSDYSTNFYTDFPLLASYSYGNFLNYIGEAYPTIQDNPDVPTNTTAWGDVFSWIRQALTGFMPALGYTLIPGITIGTLILVPITMNIILFVISLFKR